MTNIPLASWNNFEKSIYLFVEGEFDKEVLNCLFKDDPVIVEPLGSCHILRPVSSSPFISKQYSFFLIDRDHYPYCASVPTKLETKDQLITWSKRELENYFLDADFLTQLPKNILNAAKDEIEERTLEICQKRFFCDVADYVMKSLRMEMRIVWDHLGSDANKCLTREVALKALLRVSNDSKGLLKQYQKHHLNDTSLRTLLNLKLDAWKTIQTGTIQLTEQAEIKQRFNYYHKLMAGDLTDRLVLGKGEWLNMTDGKKVLNELVNNTGFFLNDDTDVDVAKQNIVAKQLLQVPGVKLPGDFIVLKKKIKRRAQLII